MNKSKGSIYNIQNFSLHDGPGARAVVFFKGCSLRCAWCHNPESISSAPQLLYYPEKCMGCGRCVEVCKNGAHIIKEGMHVFDRSRCALCLACADTCYAEALASVGQEVDVGYVMEAVLGERPYFGKEGGVTLSGGECMLQIDFLEDILKACAAEGIHTAVDTAGNVPWSSFQRILGLTDLFFYDIKAADDALHRDLTGAGNALILSNLKRLSEAGARIWIRVPYIKEANEADMEGIADIAASAGAERVELLPFHRLGGSKYGALGIAPEGDFTPPTAEDISRVASLFRQKGVDIKT